MAHESTVQHGEDTLDLMQVNGGISEATHYGGGATVTTPTVECHTASEGMLPCGQIFVADPMERNNSSPVKECGTGSGTGSTNQTGRVTMMDRQISLGAMAAQKAQKAMIHQNSVPHLFAETPKAVTHHHDTDDEDTDHSDDKS